MSPQDSRPERRGGLSAKEEILARLRTALAAPGQAAPMDASEVPRAYQRADDKQEVSTDPAKIRDVLVKRLEDYTVAVHRTSSEEVGTAIAAALEGMDSVVVPPQLPRAWTEGLSAQVRVDDGTLSARDLDKIDAVLTGAHTAIALTGTIVLRADEVGGRRALTLVPDRHVVVLDATQVVLGVPKAVERMQEDPTAAWTMISGPSATSDIELERVEGVHGPRRLHVVLVEPEPEPKPEASGDETPGEKPQVRNPQARAAQARAAQARTAQARGAQARDRQARDGQAARTQTPAAQTPAAQTPAEKTRRAEGPQCS